jgi:hypothetical protein
MRILEQRGGDEGRYQLKPGWVMITSDYNEPEFNWSRIVRNNFIKEHGWLTLRSDKRIEVNLLKRNEENGRHYEEPVDPLYAELVPLLEEDKASIIHYYPSGAVSLLVLNVDLCVLGGLDPQYRRLYRDYT